MRIAIFSDIHGNVISLKAVLAHIEKAQIDNLICLGDVATMGPRPKETVSLLRQLECTFIMGNHDEYVLDPEVGRSYMDAEWFVRTIRWGQSQLS
ncbi:MAG: metallophosphatase family protein, partial [Candidatus Thermofonsia bacterium]